MFASLCCLRANYGKQDDGLRGPLVWPSRDPLVLHTSVQGRGCSQAMRLLVFWLAGVVEEGIGYFCHSCIFTVFSVIFGWKPDRLAF